MTIKTDFRIGTTTKNRGGGDTATPLKTVVSRAEPVEKRESQMSKKHNGQYTDILFFIAIVITCVASVCVGIFFPADTTSLHENTIRDISSGWQYQTATGRQEIPALPAAVKLSNTDGSAAKSLTLYYRLPENLPPDACLEFISHQTSVEVLIDNQLIYTYGANNNAMANRLRGNVRNMIALPDNSGGKEITVRLSSSYFIASYQLNTVTLGSRAEILQQFVRSNVGIVVFCLFSAFFCIASLLLVIYLTIKKIDVNAAFLLYFNLFVFLSTIWILTDSYVLQLLTANLSLVYFISHMAFMLFPIPLFLFLQSTALYGKRWYSALSCLYLLVFFLRSGLFFSGVADLEITLFITHIVMAFSTVTGGILLFKEWHLYHEKITVFFLAGLVLLAACLVISLILFFVPSEVEYSSFFIAVLIVLMAAMLYRLMFSFQSVAKKGIKAQVYREMAYTDILTKLRNRQSFEKEMNAIQEKPECHTLTLVMFDLNRLKHINDTYGHSAGDKLIQSAADCIQKHFLTLGKCYRIGGDEFVVILKDFSEQSIDKILKEFRRSVAEADAGNPEGLSISAGYASGPAEGADFAYQLLDRADQYMYAKKRRMHETRQ